MQTSEVKDWTQYIQSLNDNLNVIPEMQEVGQELADWQNGQTERPLNVMIMGEAKSGKSTFVNSIFGEQLVASDILPKTSIVTMFKYGAQKKMVIYFLDGRIVTYENNQFADLSNESIDKEIDWVEMYWPLDFLKEITIIDSPGLNSQYAYHTKNTERFFNRVDVVMWVADCRTIQTQVAHQYLEKLMHNHLPTVMVINQIDNYDEEEEEQELEEWIADERNSFIDQYQLVDVIGISAAYILKGKIKKDNQLLENGHFQSVSNIVNKLEIEAVNLKERSKWRYFVYLQCCILARVKMLIKNLHIEQMYLSIEELSQSWNAILDKRNELQHFIEYHQVKIQELTAYIATNKTFLSLVSDEDHARLWLDTIGTGQSPVVSIKIEELKKQLSNKTQSINSKKEKLLQTYQRLLTDIDNFRSSGVYQTYPLFKNTQLDQLENEIRMYNVQVKEYRKCLEKENGEQEAFVEQLCTTIQFINYNNRQVLHNKIITFNQLLKRNKQDYIQKISLSFFQMINQLSMISSAIVSLNNSILANEKLGEIEKENLEELIHCFEPFKMNEKLAMHQKIFEALIDEPLLTDRHISIDYSTSELSMIDAWESSPLNTIQTVPLSLLNQIRVNVIKMRVLFFSCIGIIILFYLFK
ncbi:dynamin family protein [Sporolactobacillus nakayamae]|uniref:Small GTP-binding protein domain-containing protein n=1 Tax=Sporolactobacillus nakayamae TaxID=269670 RepID=A0A1I2U9K1_9BACL|nr:dynamin family protein [Sporolactobacillus nakayamae]SFG73792.1 small GTP-binding protein domain-containing protein [Sporolactobacillus nakayamae]